MDSEGIKNRSFVGAIAAAVKALFMVIIDLLDVAEEGVAMASKAVQVARDKQVIDLTVTMQNYEEIVRVQAAHEQAVAKEALQEYTKGNEARTKLVQENLVRLGVAIKAAQAEVQLERQNRR